MSVETFHPKSLNPLLQDSATLDMLAECYGSIKTFCKVFFPEAFYLPFCEEHEKLFQLIDNREVTRGCCVSSRGFGKTTIVNMALPCHSIVFADRKYIVPVSCSSKQAEMQSENLKNELVCNEMIVKLFGPMKSNQFSKEQWVAANGVCIMPRGGGQQIRGLKYRNYRPDFIIVDDLESTEEVMSEEQRHKLKSWFMSDLMGSVNYHNKDNPPRILVIGNMLHERSLIADLSKDPMWTFVRATIVNEQNKSNWPEALSDKEIKKLMDSYRMQGQLETFYREYRALAIPVGETLFRVDMFKHYDESDEKLDANPNIENVLLVDIARTTKETSSYSCIVCVGVNTFDAKLYVRDLFMERVSPSALIDQVFDMAQRWNCRAIGVEEKGLHEHFMYPLKTEMVRRGRYYDIVVLPPYDKKENRIMQLENYYKRGQIFHNKAVCGPLEDQLLSFPRPEYWDAMDAFAYIVFMLEYGGRYFGSWQMGRHASVEEKQKQFKELKKKYMPPLSNWRRV